MAVQGKNEDSEQGGTSISSELESRLLPLLDNDGLTKPGQRSGVGLASILPYLVKALKARPKPPPPEAPKTLPPHLPR